MGTEQPWRPDPNAAAKGPFFMDEFVVGSDSARDACAYFCAGGACLYGRRDAGASRDVRKVLVTVHCFKEPLGRHGKAWSAGSGRW